MIFENIQFQELPFRQGINVIPVNSEQFKKLRLSQVNFNIFKKFIFVVSMDKLKIYAEKSNQKGVKIIGDFYFGTTVIEIFLLFLI